MTEHFEIAVLVGSLRRDSFTKAIARALIENAPDSCRCKLIEIGDLALYNEDLEGKVPAWARFRKEIGGADAVLFLTPEYNRSIPACLKNAIDVGSRPQDKSVWSGKPAGVVSVTPYKLGAFGANHALRQALVFLDMPVMQQPEAYIGGAGELFDEDGSLKSKETKAFLAKFTAAFERWVRTITAGADSGDFEAFMELRAAAASAYVSGDAKPLDAIAATAGPATFFPPKGGAVTDAGKVVTRYDADAKAFSPGGVSSLEILQSAASGNIAFWTGFQNAEVKIGGRSMKMKLRITELFRRSGGVWKLVHRHADSLSEPEQKP